VSCRIKIKGLFLYFLLFFIWTWAGNAQNHVAVSPDEAKIYVDPNTDSLLYIIATKGDTFETTAFRDSWVKINLFTGEERYIKRAEVEIVDEIAPYPADPSVRSEICNSIKIDKITSQASNTAMSKHPDDVKRQGAYEQLLVDKYVLGIFRKFEIPASHYSMLMECVQDDIRGPVIRFN
jgi:hypothetical protein